MIYTVTLNPAIDKTVEISGFLVGEVNRIEKSRMDAGGKGINVSKCLKAMNCESVALGFLAGQGGRFIEDYLDSKGIIHDFIRIEGETRTNLKLVDKKNGTNTDINENGPLVSEMHLELMSQKLEELIRNEDLVIFSGSLPKGVPTDIYGKWIELVQKKGAKALLDADHESLQLGIKGIPFLLKPNIHELERLTGKELKTINAVREAAQPLLESGIQEIVVSMGGEGALFLTKESGYFAQGLKVPVSSTVGAGDSTVAALAYGLHNGLKKAELITLAVATGAANVMTEGTQAASFQSIKELMNLVKFEELS